MSKNQLVYRILSCIAIIMGSLYIAISAGGFHRVFHLVSIVALSFISLSFYTRLKWLFGIAHILIVCFYAFFAFLIYAFSGNAVTGIIFVSLGLFSIIIGILEIKEDVKKKL